MGFLIVIVYAWIYICVCVCRHTKDHRNSNIHIHSLVDGSSCYTTACAARGAALSLRPRSSTGLRGVTVVIRAEGTRVRSWYWGARLGILRLPPHSCGGC